MEKKNYNRGQLVTSGGVQVVVEKCLELRCVKKQITAITRNCLKSELVVVSALVWRFLVNT